jgi:signal transduction histidine kinase
MPYLAALFESAFNSFPAGSTLLSPTPEATILAVNDVFLQLSGRVREELVGVSVFAVFPGSPDDPQENGEAQLRASLARVIATGKSETMPAQRYPIPVTRDDGAVVFEERFWNAVNTPVFGPDGAIACISHITTDVTEQVRATTALRESEARFRALTTATADVVYRMNPDWTEVRQLEGRGFLKDTSTPSRIWLDEYIPHEDRAALHRAIGEAIRDKSVFQLEHRVHRLDGGWSWMLSRAVPMLDAGGRIHEWIGAATDITKRKLAEAKLKESDRRKDEFLAMLAHELRNPLAPIGAAAQLLQSARKDEALIDRTSRIIGRQVTHMSELIDDLLDVSRVTRGQVALHRTTLDLGRTLEDAVEQVMPLVRARRQQLAVRLPARPIAVTADKKRLVQVFANLLNNAAKYTPEEGHIELGAEIHDDPLDARVTVYVADDGIGMAPDLVARAFELFAQAERTSDRASGGLGLGLALVRNLVELHGGTVACASAGLGKGSRFSVSLPYLPDAAPVPDPQHPGHASPARARRIMIVDDNVDAATMLGLLLEASGYGVEMEHDGPGALARARREAPEVCLLDIGLPGMDGIELARRLRALPETEHALLVAITGYGQESDRQQALAAGFDHHMVKPIDIGKLQAVLDSRGD